MSNVVELNNITTLDLDPERVLSRALREGLSQVVIVGFDKDDNEYFASSVSDGGSIIWHLERAKHRLLFLADQMKDTD